MEQQTSSIGIQEILLAKRALDSFKQEKNRVREEQFARILSESADLSFYFISDNRAYTTGQIICVDPTFENYYLNAEAVQSTFEDLGMAFGRDVSMATALFFVSRALMLHEALHVLKTDFRSVIPVDIACRKQLTNAYRQLENVLEDSFIENWGMVSYPGMKPFLAFLHVLGHKTRQTPLADLEKMVKKATDHAKLRGIARSNFFESFFKAPLISEIWEKRWNELVERMPSTAEPPSGEREKRRAQRRLWQFQCLIELCFMQVARFASYDCLRDERSLRDLLSQKIARQDFSDSAAARESERSYLDGASTLVEDTARRFEQMRPLIERYIRTDHQGLRTVLMNEIFSYLRDLPPEEDESEAERRTRMNQLAQEMQILDAADLQAMMDEIKSGKLKPEDVMIQLIPIDRSIGQSEQIDGLLQEMLALGVELTLTASRNPLFEKASWEVTDAFSEGIHKHIPLKIVSMIPDERAKDGYRHTLVKYRRQLNKYANAFKDLFEVERHSPIGRLRIGSSIDSRRLLSKDRAFWQKQVYAPSYADITVTVLVDLSGSMSGVMNKVIDCLVILYETCQRSGIRISIFGHAFLYDLCGNDDYVGGQTVIYKIAGFAVKKDAYCLLDIEADGCNRDGHALIFCRDWIMQNQDEYKKNLLLTINDGLPSAPDYAGEAAEADVRREVERCGQQGIELLSIFLGEMDERERASFRAMYADFVEVQDTNQLLPILMKGIYRML